MVVQEHSDTPILDNPSNEHNVLIPVKLSFIQKIKLRFLGIVYVGDHMEEGWRSTIPFYAFNCKQHGLQYGYPIGHSNLMLCPECMR